MPKSSTDKRHFYIVGALVLVFTLLLGWLLNAALPMPIQASVEGETIDWLFRVHMWLIAFLFSLVITFMVYALVVFRRRKGDESEGDHFEGNTLLEIIWTAAPLVLVVVFGVIGVQALDTVTAKGENEETIHAEGAQWFWRFEYENGVTAPELMVPLGQRVVMKLTTRDVNHAFWVPEFRVKQDVVAGMETEVRFTATEIGEYSLLCAELCGGTHWSMVAPVKVVSQEEYTAWLQDQYAVQTNQTASADN
jgi:cytochrome c oxidase subunit 2